MTAKEPSAASSPEEAAQRSADRLALALEDVGFDVGLAFPMLHGGVGPDGAPIVDLGRVTEPIANQLATILASAAESRRVQHEPWP